MIDFALLAPIGAWAVSFIGTALLLRWLLRAKWLDHPNERSNHKAPVPRGGGLAMVISILIFLALGNAPWPLLAALALLAVVSFVDDRKSLPAALRFLTQLIAVILAMQTLPGRVLPALPLYVEYALVAFAWLWFINLTNFMDGIDGITVFETLAICGGLCLILLIAPAPSPNLVFPVAQIVAAAALGFYSFNHHPARLFIGDVGSIPLGFILAYLLFSLASFGYLAAALILPAYYVSDATFTLLARAFRREKLWQAHSQHGYQRAVRSGLSHQDAVLQITLLNLALIALALLSTHSMMAAICSLAAAYGGCAYLLRRFHALSHS